MITDYHAKLYSHELQRRCASDDVQRFTAALMDSKVDINPHQVDAALFAFRSPLSKGALLADEVGLGKTIEAGIVLSQKWAEKKRRILIILPSNLRKQWNQELLDKFYLPSRILEAGNFNKEIRQGAFNPFDTSEIVLCSFQFARNKSDYIRRVDWDLVVIDEAHRLRNVYKTGNKIARELKQALAHTPKLLLTATPLQNSLLELYGLVGFIDNHAFGDLKSFKAKYARLTTEDGFEELRLRLRPVCHRTLRRQVLEYVRFTERKAYTQEFIPSEDEDVLYDMVSDYLRRPDLQALPVSQRSLMTLVLRKLLASSTFAIAGALSGLAAKLEKRLKTETPVTDEKESSADDFEAWEDLKDEDEPSEAQETAPLTLDQKTLIQKEIQELKAFYEQAMKITQNAKGQALLHALRIGFEMAFSLGGAEKAIIFTESRRTQAYLVSLLSENGYSQDIVLFNGTNNDSKTRDIYVAWKNAAAGTDKLTGSRTADTRAALVDYFSSTAKIMIATEAAAEGINLQFCSLVVNYDLSWNPQRIEQRIGRCHRYGQKHDVVVINFLNKHNAADQRVYQLLSEKFRLFSGVFGASDEILGSIESGVDFEKRIAHIYQTCRDPEAIQASFDALQKELGQEINEHMKITRQKLLDHFDAEVAEKLNVYKARTALCLNQYEALLWDLTRHVLKDKARFNEETLTFDLVTPPAANQMDPPLPLGCYTLKPGSIKGYHYRLRHPLAQWVLAAAGQTELPATELVFNYSGSGKNIHVLKPLAGRSGSLTAHRLTINALEPEDYVFCSAVTANGRELDEEQARRLFNLPARITPVHKSLTRETLLVYDQMKKKSLHTISERNAVFFEAEMDKLDRWAEDRKNSLEIRIKDTDAKIGLLKAEARKTVGLEQKLKLQRQAKALEKSRSDMRRTLFDAQDEIDREKERLLDSVEARLKQTIEEEVLFEIAWRVE